MDGPFRAYWAEACSDANLFASLKQDFLDERI
jgi:hypothetical protein